MLRFFSLPLKNQPIKIAQRKFENLREIDFADTGEHYDTDLLIGSDCNWKIFTGKTFKGKNNTDIASESKFEWILNGTVEKKTKEGENFTFANNIVHVCHVQAHPLNELDSQMKRFWELESIEILNQEKQPYNYFEESICKNQENRYEMKLPVKENHPLIHDNFQMCKKRLLKLHKNLKSDPEILSQYNKIFEEQRRLRIIETASEPGKKGKTHYLAHHPVIQEDKDTIKLRIVSDASAKTFGPSLNECLYKGSQLTPLAFDILLRFRAQVIALNADIEKAFHQISVDNDDIDYLTFLWLDNIFFDQPTITRNRFARVIFGVTSSPFCLNSTIRKYVNQYSDDPEFVNKALKLFFVDDFISGGESNEKAFELFLKLRNRFKEYHLNLRKWKTNSAQLNDLIYNENKEIHTTDNNTPKKVLGVTWNNKTDTLIYYFSDLIKEAKLLKPTKRNVLKILSSFYDPWV